MSRIGRSPVTLPKGVTVAVHDDGTRVEVKGPKGTLEVTVDPRITIRQEDDTLVFERGSDHRNDRAQHGLVRSLVANAVVGVSEGYVKHLEIQGVGYRCQMKGSTLELALGFSHPVVVEPPAGITLNAPEPTKIEVSGIDKQLVGQVAANIRAVRSPDSYHGKGVRYRGEYVRLKPGKAASR